MFSMVKLIMMLAWQRKSFDHAWKLFYFWERARDPRLVNFSLLKTFASWASNKTGQAHSGRPLPERIRLHTWHKWSWLSGSKSHCYPPKLPTQCMHAFSPWNMHIQLQTLHLGANLNYVNTRRGGSTVPRPFFTLIHGRIMGPADHEGSRAFQTAAATYSHRTF